MLYKNPKEKESNKIYQTPHLIKSNKGQKLLFLYPYSLLNKEVLHGNEYLLRIGRLNCKRSVAWKRIPVEAW